MANIAEGFNAGTDRDFGRFLRYSRRSATEVQSHAYIALDQAYIDAIEFDHLYQLSAEIIALLSGLIRYLDQQEPNSPHLPKDR